MFNRQTIPRIEEGYKSNKGEKNPYKFGSDDYFAWQYGYDKARVDESTALLVKHMESAEDRFIIPKEEYCGVEMVDSIKPWRGKLSLNQIIEENDKSLDKTSLL